MLYWIVPYLFAYNASIPSGWLANEPIGWKYGPEHVFSSKVSLLSTNTENELTAQPYYHIKFVCRPISQIRHSTIRCRIIWAKMTVLHRAIVDKEFGMDGIMFDVGFNAKGISRLWFINNNDIYYHNIIRAIIGTMNMGISIADKTVGNYVFPEKSVIGTCDTNLIIKNEILSDLEQVDETQVKGFEFVVPSLGPLAVNETIVIEKDRHPRECIKKTPYFFGKTTHDNTTAEPEAEIVITTSRSQLNLGKRSFSASTESSGIVKFYYKDELSTKHTFHVNENIRVKLEAIRPAMPDLKVDKHLKYIGAGFERGIPWPGLDDEQEMVAVVELQS